MFLLLSLHVMANLVWIGSITSVGWLVATASRGGDQAKPAAELAAGIYRRIATPAFGVSFAFGIAVLLTNTAYYMHAHWFHGKLTFALVVIALHHVLGAKAKRAASGGVQAGSSGAILTAGLLASAFAVVVFVIYKTALVP
jgi:putative membrane protein